MTSKPEQHKETRIGQDKSFELVLFNDAVNSFEFVIEKLVEHCNHDPEQAEQCALIAHHNGECNVLVGSQEKVTEVGIKLGEEGLTIDIRKLTV